MSRVINFSPGPSTLPLPVLERAQRELLDFDGSGISMLEHSHRGAKYSAVHEEAKSLLKELVPVPDTHEILFMQGGATGQFALVPMNFLPAGKSADYINTGSWSKKAFAEAEIVGEPRWAGTGQVDGKFIRVPKQSDLELDSGAAYVHLTSNNTIAGTQFHTFPDTGSVPIVADMSSDFLWRPIDVSRFGLIYAGAQKNLGPAGITVVIARKDLLEAASTKVPKIFRYSFIAENNSLQNTAPTFTIYMVRNVLQWVKENGGASAMETRNQKKANMLYGCIDEHEGFYRCPVERESRSVMNVVFTLPSEELEKKFMADAAAEGMVNTKGHRSVGGIRISMYNAMGPQEIEKLTGFMKSFAQKNG